MMVRLGIPTALAVVFMLLAVPMVSEISDASVDQTYRSQLDDNGRDVYDELSRTVGIYDNTVKVNVVLDDAVLFDSKAEAETYGRSVALNAMAARYYTDPTVVHLWNLPVEVPEVKVSTTEVTLTSRSGDGKYFVATSLDFALTVPDNMKDDLTTTQNEFKDRVGELKEVLKSKQFGGDPQFAVRDVSAYLKKVKVVDDEEGKVSNLYDALVLKKSSSAGIASAFTAICNFNGIDAVTVKGTYYPGAGDDDSETRYWNQVRVDGKWYAGDVVAFNDSRSSGFMMAGSASWVSMGGNGIAFSTAHEVDLDLAAANGLGAPALEREGFPYPDETPVSEKYGPYVILALIGLVLVATIYHAMKHGSL